MTRRRLSIGAAAAAAVLVAIILGLWLGVPAAVRDHLGEQGKVPRERLFLVAPLLDGSGDAKLPPTRVDFSLK